MRPGRFAARQYCSRCPARLAAAGRSPNSPGAHNAPRAQSKVSRLPPALLGARLAPTGVLTPDGALLLSSAALGPGAAIRDILVAYGGQRHPVFAPFRALSQSLAMLGCAICV